MDSCFSNIFQFEFIFWILYKIINRFYAFLSLGRAGVRYPLPWFPLSDGSRRCSCRTTVNCRPCPSFLLGCRFGRSGSSGFVGRFCLLRCSSCGPVPRIFVYRTHFTSGLEDSCWLQFAKYFNLDMYRMPFPIITIKFFYII